MLIRNQECDNTINVVSEVNLIQKQKQKQAIVIVAVQITTQVK